MQCSRSSSYYKVLLSTTIRVLLLATLLWPGSVLASDSGPDDSAIGAEAAAEMGSFANELADILGEEANSNIRSTILDLAKEGAGATADLARSFSNFNSTLAQAIANPSKVNIDAVSRAGVSFGLAATGTALTAAIGVALAEAGLSAAAVAASGFAVGTALGVAAHYGSTAISSIGKPSPTSQGTAPSVTNVPR